MNENIYIVFYIKAIDLPVLLNFAENKIYIFY